MPGLYPKKNLMTSLLEHARVSKTEGRYRRYVSFLSIGTALLALAACDPASLIRSKVPKPIQEILQFSKPGKPAPGAPGVPQGPKASIIQPIPNGIYLFGKEVLFQGAASAPKVPGVPPPQLSWTLYVDKQPQPTALGKGPVVKKALPAGNYRVEAAADFQGQRATQTVTFRVIHALQGKVVTRDGRGIPQIDLVLSDLTGENVISSAKSGPVGGFTIEVPPQGHFLLRPRKQGFGFNPYNRIVVYHKDAQPVQFTGIDSEIKDVLLTGSETGDQALSSLCPLQEGYVRYSITGAMKPTRLEAFLVHIVGNAAQRIELDEVKNAATGDSPSAEAAAKWMKVRVPSDLKIGAKEIRCHLAVVARNDNGDVITARAPGAIKINLLNCFVNRLSEAVALQEKGDLAEAIKMYESIESMYKKLPDPSPLSDIFEKSQFNRGLAHISEALSLTRQDREYREALGSALSEFSSVLKGKRKDAQALLMRGVTKDLLEEYDAAVTDFSAALELEAKSVPVLQLRARALLASKEKRNLSPALDDLTEAISLEPDNQDLRKIRRETLKLIVGARKEKDGTEADTSKLPLGAIDKIVKPDDYVRK